MVDISVIIPVYNGEIWINNCMKSITDQSIFDTEIKVEIVVHNDGSQDSTERNLLQWRKYFESRAIRFIITSWQGTKGVGAAKNNAVRNSVGEFICFQDIDDTMHQNRLLLQWKAGKMNHNALIGSRISRIPTNSTPRLVRWANNLTSEQLKLQIYTSNGPTLLMPTWFCHRSVFNKVGGFDESGCGTPEDLIFFYRHLDLGGDVQRVDEELVVYTYHEGAVTFSITREQIWEIQLRKLERDVFPHWNNFTVWNAGKSGRRLIRALNQISSNKVVAFCDVDKKKIGRIIELYCPIMRRIVKRLPVVHFTEAKPPLLICVKLDLTKGQFESNLKSLNLIEGIDYVLFT